MRKVFFSVQLILAFCFVQGGLEQPSRQKEVLILEGTVTDPQGYPIPGATVLVASDPDVGRRLATDGQGSFVTELSPGRYSLQVEIPGFQLYEDTIFLSRSNSRLSIRLALDTGREEVVVRAEVPEWASEMTLEEGRIKELEGQDLAGLLRNQPGTAAVRRGVINMEPTIRGLQETQIGMFVDRTRTFAAGPARMDSDISHVSPHIVRSIRAVKGPYALSWGAGALSALQLETFRPPFYDDEFQVHGKVGYRYGSNAVAQDGHATFWGANAQFRMHIFYNRREGNDYRTGDGQYVPGGYGSDDFHWSLGLRLHPTVLLDYVGGYQEQNDMDYPGRLLDVTYFFTRSNAVGLSWKPEGSTFSEVRAQFYLNLKDHLMNNDRKPTGRPMSGRMPPFALLVDLPTESNTVGGDLSTLLERGGWDWRFGFDFYNSDQTATRSIFRKDMNRLIFQDIVWPDAGIDDQGAYLETIYDGERAQLAGTVRVDLVQASADEVSEFFQANTQGPLDQEETHLSAALNGKLLLSQPLGLTIGLGRAVRTATVLERYSDRFPSSKFQIAAEFMGNPTLDPEESLEFSLGSELELESTRLSLDFFHRKIENYITIQTEPGLPKRLPLSPPTVFRYVNGSEARFYGTELVLQQQLGSYARLSGFFSYLWGQDELFDEPVLGLTPAQGQLALELHTPDRKYWLNLAAIAVDDQSRVAISRFEQSTAGYVFFDLRGRVSLSASWTLKAGVENIGNRLYSNHLNSPNPFTRMRIPEMGRNVYMGLEYAF